MTCFLEGGPLRRVDQEAQKQGQGWLMAKVSLILGKLQAGVWLPPVTCPGRDA